MKKIILSLTIGLTALVNAQENKIESTGNVGIGTTDPKFKLHIIKDKVNNGHYLNNSNIIENEDSRLQILSANSHQAGSMLFLSNAPSDGNNKHWSFHHTGITRNNRLEIGYGTSAASGEFWDINSKMTVLTNGNVGIGTNNPLHGKLQISGKGANEGITLWSNSGELSSRIWTDPAKTLFHISRGTDPLQGITLNKIGNVGIGTTTPLAQLEVKSTNTFGGLWAPVRSFFTVTDGTNTLIMDPNEIYTNSKLHIGSKSGDIVEFRNLAEGANQTKMLIKANGNVGIGTIEPKSKLDVNGAITIKKASNVDNASPAITLNVKDDFLYDGEYINHYGFGFHGYQDGSTTGHYSNPTNTYLSGHFGIDFFTKGVNRMRISRGGIVSIGAVNRQEGYKLAVNGKIKAKEIKVETGWSDFVFEKQYNLPSLEQVENHIKEKGHLKDIPSAKEVSENGIFLGEMNSKLLQKIEELTLYTIAQEKKITQLESLNKKLIDLQVRLEKLELKN